MLASFQVEAGDKTGRIWAAPFIATQESERLLYSLLFQD